jgi:hypothetical protein
LWWYKPVISAVVRQRKENYQFKASLNDIVRSCLKKSKENKVREGGNE